MSWKKQIALEVYWITPCPYLPEKQVSEITRKAIFTVARSFVISYATSPAGSSLKMSSGARRAATPCAFFLCFLAQAFQVLDLVL